MSIEDEIKRKRVPTPTWKALDRLDGIAELIRRGSPWQDTARYQEVVKPTPKAEVRPPLVVAASESIDRGISEQLMGRAGAWDGFKFQGTVTGRLIQPKPVVKHGSAMLGALKALEKLKQRGGKDGTA